MLRKFAALAGTLEILESEFLALKDERHRLIEHYRQVYDDGGESRIPLDPARLIGFMESEFPENPRWKLSEQEGKPLPLRVDVTCVEALKAVGRCTAFSLRKELRSVGFKSIAKRFAEKQDLSRGTISHLSMIVLAVARRSLNSHSMSSF